MNPIQITATSKIIGGEVHLPLSKSISNRALMISAISGGKVKTGDLSESDDTVLLQKLFQQIKEGKDKHVDAKDAGTTYRFLTAYLAITPGEWILEGSERMHQRPIGPLVEGLQQIGADVSYTGKKGYPPLVIKGKALHGGEVVMNAQISSQFVSALMMIAPALPFGLKITLFGPGVSMPYIDLTASLMKTAGVDIKMELPEINISGKDFKETSLPSETDWSSASYWYELFSLSRAKELFIHGLKENSIQGDSVLYKYFGLLGVETIFENGGTRLKKAYVLNSHINFFLTDIPDLAPAIIVTTAARGLNGSFIGLSSLRLKESDRMEVMATELGKAGINCKINNDELSFDAQAMDIKLPFDTYNDHRMAMAFAPLAILGKPVTINNPEVVSKSYPGFWRELKKVLSFEG